MALRGVRLFSHVDLHLMEYSSVASKTCTVKYMKKYHKQEAMYGLLGHWEASITVRIIRGANKTNYVIKIFGKYVKGTTRNPTFSRRLFSDSGIWNATISIQSLSFLRDNCASITLIFLAL